MVVKMGVNRAHLAKFLKGRVWVSAILECGVQHRSGYDSPTRAVFIFHQGEHLREEVPAWGEGCC